MDIKSRVCLAPGHGHRVSAAHDHAKLRHNLVVLFAAGALVTAMSCTQGHESPFGVIGDVGGTNVTLLTVTQVNLSSAPLRESVTITGTNFFNITGVAVDGVPTQSFEVLNETEIVLRLPDINSGSKDVTVISSTHGSDTCWNCFTYNNTMGSPFHGLIAYYPLDGNADDASGNEHHGDVLGPVAASDRFGAPNRALEFDGIDDFVKLPYDISFYPASLGISFWVFMDGSATNPQVPLTANGSGASPPYDPYGITLSSGTVTVAFEGNNPPGPSDEQILLTGSFSSVAGWHHLAASYDYLAGVARLWLDGSLADHVEKHITLGDNTLGLMLGARQNPSGGPFGFHLDGRLDEVRIYSRALTVRDVRILCDLRPACSPRAGQD